MASELQYFVSVSFRVQREDNGETQDALTIDATGRAGTLWQAIQPMADGLASGARVALAELPRFPVEPDTAGL